MSTSVILPTYFGPIDLFSKLVDAESLTFEVCDNYQKQTYRTRQYIYGANGKLLLNIPIKHQKDLQKERQLMADVLIDNSFAWQKTHLKSLQIAYRTSPYYEFYEHEFEELYSKEFTHLIDFNLATWECILNLLELDLPIEKTEKYEASLKDSDDLRYLGVAKRKPIQTLNEYIQVFATKHGFIPNLSILDLLFNEGPNTTVFLRS